MNIRFSRISFTAIIFAASFMTLAFAESIEAKSSLYSVQPGSPPGLINSAIRRDQKIEIVSALGAVSEEFEIQAPEANFIKLHFSKFKLPAGITIQISNPEGSEVYRYSSTNKDAMTFNPRQGDDGVSSFSATCGFVVSRSCGATGGHTRGDSQRS